MSADAVAWPTSVLPPELNSALPPSQLREQCIHDYEKFVNDDLALQSAVFGSEDPDEPKLSDRRLEAALQRTLTSLSAEEARWCDGAIALERRWEVEAAALAARWRDEDAAQIDQQQQHATDEAQKSESLLSGLVPLRVVGWAALADAMRLGSLGTKRVAAICAVELAPRPAAAVASSSNAHANASWASQATLIPVTQLRRLLGALRAAGAGPLDGEPLCSAICDALGRSAASEEALSYDTAGVRCACASHRESSHSGSRQSESGSESAGSDASASASEIPPMAVLAFLLTLVEGASALQRLDALLAALLPRTLTGTPLTAAEQRLVFSELSAASRTALKASITLAEHAPSPGHGGAALSCSPLRSLPAPPPLHAVLEQRPRSWAFCPPDARAYAVWCATKIAQSTIGAALIGATDASTEAV